MVTANESAMSARLLVVDDEEPNVRLLQRILDRAGYTEVRATTDPRDVERLVHEFNPDLLLLDLHMPHIDGFGVLERLAPHLDGAGDLSVLMLTGDTTPEAKRNALSLGAKDFVAKPFDGGEVLLRIRNMLETRFLYSALEKQNGALEVRVKERTRELDDSQLEIVERLARAGEIRDDATGRHTQRVGDLSALLAEALGAGTRFVDFIRRAAPLHDVGKIGIPDNILLKPGKLTEQEIVTVQSHTVIGARILSGGHSELVKMAERIALSHHERWNGRGYPNRLAGEDIPFEARIVGLADFIDALTHIRPYRAAWPLDAVLSEVRGESGKHFDPAVVGALLDSRCYESVVSPSLLRPKPLEIALNGLQH